MQQDISACEITQYPIGKLQPHSNRSVEASVPQFGTSEFETMRILCMQELGALSRNNRATYTFSETNGSFHLLDSSSMPDLVKIFPLWNVAATSCSRQAI